jgi:hypothetical protein
VSNGTIIVSGLVNGSSWISGAIGSTSPTSNTIVIGTDTFGNSVIGSHSGALNAWKPININRFKTSPLPVYDGEDTNIGISGKFCNVYSELYAYGNISCASGMTIFTNSITEKTAGAGITFSNTIKADIITTNVTGDCLINRLKVGSDGGSNESLFVDTGALKFRNGSGSVVTIVPNSASLKLSNDNSQINDLINYIKILEERITKLEKKIV